MNPIKENAMNYEVKADSLSAAFDKAIPATAITRPSLSGGSTANAARSAFVDGYLRRGNEVELKSITGAAAADGGYAVPQEIDAVIDTALKSISPIRAIANVVRVGSSGYRKLVTQNGVASGWASENGARAETATPKFNEVVPSFGDLYANPAATQRMLDDTAFDVEEWLASEIAAEFAKAEGSAFVSGNGTDKPKGFLAAPTAATSDATRPFGTLQYVPSGLAGGFAAAAPENKLIDLVHSLRAPYRQGAVWVMNATTLAAIRKFKTTDGAFIWQAGLVAGQPDTLLGYPVVEAEDMPDIAANSLSIAFGNFKAGYLIAERAETNIIRDPFTNKPYVHFYATKRVGGTVSNSEAIKLMKFAVS
jgi:HK97 family phage major capsid protein